MLEYLHEEGMSIEPDFFVPIIPLVLVNGSEGIGTGLIASEDTGTLGRLGILFAQSRHIC